MENQGVRFPGKYKIFLANDIFPYTGTVCQRKLKCSIFKTKSRAG